MIIFALDHHVKFVIRNIREPFICKQRMMMARQTVKDKHPN